MIKIVIDHLTGRIEKVELPPSDKQTLSEAFQVYQALAEEIQSFLMKNTKTLEKSMKPTIQSYVMNPAIQS